MWGVSAKTSVAASVLALAGLGTGFLIHELADPAAATRNPQRAGVYNCPDDEVLTGYASGSRVYATGRTSVGDWIRLRDLDAPDRAVWVRASDIELDNDVSALPIASCDDFSDTVRVGAGVTGTTTTPTTSSPPTTTTSPQTTTSTSTTTQVPASTTSTSTTSTSTTTVPTTSTTTTTTTTQPPDTSPPSIDNANVTPSEIWELDSQVISCGAVPREATISAFVTDNGSGVDRVRASWTIGGTGEVINLSGTGGNYSGTFGPFPYQTVAGNTAPEITVIIEARDEAGNTSEVVASVTVHSTNQCFG